MGEEAYDEVDLPAAHPHRPNDERTLCIRGGYSRTEVYVGICRTKYDSPDGIISVDGAELKRAPRGMQIGPPRERSPAKARRAADFYRTERPKLRRLLRRALEELEAQAGGPKDQTEEEAAFLQEIRDALKPRRKA